MADDGLSATVDNFNLTFHDVVVHTFSGMANADVTNQDREVGQLAS